MRSRIARRSAAPGHAAVAHGQDVKVRLDVKGRQQAGDNAGNYVVTPLQVGRYSVKVGAAGFKKAVASNITVNVQDRVRVCWS